MRRIPIHEPYLDSLQKRNIWKLHLMGYTRIEISDKLDISLDAIMGTLHEAQSKVEAHRSTALKHGLTIAPSYANSETPESLFRIMVNEYTR